MKIQVSITHGHQTLSQGYDLGEVYERCFQQLRTSEDPFIGWVVGDQSAEVVADTVKLRKDAAKRISDTITEALIRMMQQEDTYNGYKITNED